jgi:hypothetical protein
LNSSTGSRHRVRDLLRGFYPTRRIATDSYLRSLLPGRLLNRSALDSPPLRGCRLLLGATLRYLLTVSG